MHRSTPRAQLGMGMLCAGLIYGSALFVAACSDASNSTAPRRIAGVQSPRFDDTSCELNDSCTCDPAEPQDVKASPLGTGTIGVPRPSSGACGSTGAGAGWDGVGPEGCPTCLTPDEQDAVEEASWALIAKGGKCAQAGSYVLDLLDDNSIYWTNRPVYGSVYPTPIQLGYHAFDHGQLMNTLAHEASHALWGYTHGGPPATDAFAFGSSCAGAL